MIEDERIRYVFVGVLGTLAIEMLLFMIMATVTRVNGQTSDEEAND